MDTDKKGTSPYTFSGSIPRHYDQYQGPMYFEPYAKEIASRIKPSTIQLALEIACGTGRVTRHLRAAIPKNAKLIASDISPDMMAIAKEKLKDADVEWKIIDATELPFDDESIDLIVCCFGYMFVADKVKAFAEAYRALRPAGVLLFTTWDQLELNGASYVHRKNVRKYLGEFLPESFLLAFSMHDEEAMQKQLKLAGFTKIKIDKVDKIAVSESAKHAAFGLVRGGTIYNEIMKRNPDWIDEINSIVEKELAEKFGESPMAAPMRAIIVEARK